jgi:hypothetical protein
MTLSNLISLLTLSVVAYAVIALARTARRPGPLSEVAYVGDEIVVTVTAPVWMALRRRLTAPVTSIASMRVVPPGGALRLRLRLRVCGTGWPGMGLGWFWGRDGLCYVVRRRRREAVEIMFATGRVRRWVVETTDAAAIARATT